MIADGLMVDEFREHIDFLLLKNNLSVNKWLKRPAWNTTDLEGEDLRIAVISCENSYCSALHELGHIFKKTKDEYVAWRWAKDNALYWTDEMQKIAETCLRGYEVKLGCVYPKL
jgi:hypothetical protein